MLHWSLLRLLKMSELKNLSIHHHAAFTVFPEQAEGILITEKFRGAGAHVLNVHGEQFVYEREPRDVEAASIIRECSGDVNAGVPTPTGQFGVWLDSPMLDVLHGPGYVREEFPGKYILFKRYEIDPNKKHWVIVGSSNFLSKPLAAYVMNLSSNVTQVDENCPHIAKRIKDADVISTEILKKHFVKPDMVKEGAIVLDNGNVYEGKYVFGDVDPEVYEKTAAYTPVPGGTGPMLIAMLLKNTVQAASK